MRQRVFRAHPVMAVGDPKQSIYGFRGASDGQMFSFYRHFPTEHAQPLFLSIAWRNDISVLNAANHVAEKLKEVPEWCVPLTAILPPLRFLTCARAAP